MKVYKYDKVAVIRNNLIVMYLNVMLGARSGCTPIRSPLSRCQVVPGHSRGVACIYLSWIVCLYGRWCKVVGWVPYQSCALPWVECVSHSAGCMRGRIESLISQRTVQITLNYWKVKHELITDVFDASDIFVVDYGAKILDFAWIINFNCVHSVVI